MTAVTIMPGNFSLPEKGDMIEYMKSRIDRERLTVQIMIAMYCRDHHADAGDPHAVPCNECLEQYTYAMKRIDACHWLSEGARKPVCRKCPTHCYRPGNRDRMKVIMRYAGPRMMLRHPVLAIHHFIDGWRFTRK